MHTAFLITFREGLEAALIIGILLTAMRSLGMQKKQYVVWLGVLAGLFVSLVFAWFFMTFTSGFEGKIEKLYEGILMLSAAGIITHLVFWMRKNAHQISDTLKSKVKSSLESGSLLMIGVLSTITIAREGIETVIFFQALFVQSGETVSVVSALGGILAAVLLACVIFFSTLKVPIAKLFNGLAYLLILIAAGLVAHGIVELQGANIVPTFIKPLYDLSPILSEKEGIGAILKAGFGYDANPSLLAIIGYLLYLGIVGGLYLRRNS